MHRGAVTPTAEKERCIALSTDTMLGRGVGIDAARGLEEIAFMYIAFTLATGAGDTDTIESTEYAMFTGIGDIKNSAYRSQNSEGKDYLDSGFWLLTSGFFTH